MDTKVKLPGWLAALLQSRKFWLAALAVAAGIVLFVRGDIDANRLVDLILVLVGVVIAAIAWEDGAAKLGESLVDPRGAPEEDNYEEFQG